MPKVTVCLNIDLEIDENLQHDLELGFSSAYEQLSNDIKVKLNAKRVEIEDVQDSPLE